MMKVLIPVSGFLEDALAVVWVVLDDALLLVGINSPAYSVWLEITPKVLQV
jgi:hypothetical protein